MRGFLAGGFWGLVLGGVAVGGASLINPPPSGATADLAPENELRVGDETAIAVPDAPEITAPAETAPVTETPAAETTVDAVAAPDAVEEPVADSAPDVDETAAAPSVAPETDEEAATATALLDQQEVTETADDSADEPESVAVEAPVSDEPASDDGVVAASDAPADVQSDVVEAVTPPEETAAPDVPSTQTASEPDTTAPSIAEADPVVSAPDFATETEPASAPAVANAGTLDAPETPDTTTAIAASNDEPVASPVQSDAPAAPARDELDDAAQDVTTAPLTEPTVVSDAPETRDTPPSDAPAPEVVATADTAPLTPQEPISPATPAQGDDVPVADTTSTDVETAEVVEVVDEPIVSVLPSRDTGVRVNRLALSSDAEEETTAEDAAPEAAAVDPDAPAVERFAAAYSNPDELPELSVVLTDDGSFDGAVAAVAGIPFPVSVMLNPSVDGAVDRMKAYRAAGIEVGMLINLPPAATASDVAIYFEAALGTLPEAFAVLDAEGATQGDADVIWQTVSALSEDGLGLITVPRGLNSAPRVAAENGVAAGVVFRDIDAEGQDARVISRFMDQAAFRARQNSGVIMLGQVRSETISGLTRWGAANRADTVAVVPASAALTAE